MKIIFTTCIFLLGIVIYGQEPGRVGELLKNEVTSSEIQNQQAKEFSGTSENSNRTYNSGDSRRGNHQNSPSRNSYRWHYNHGNAEVFLRIPQNGRFAVHIGDQVIENSNGKFRFFELRSGSIPISIFENNYLIYRSRINIRNNTRTVLDFFSDYGLYLLGSYQLEPNWYGANEWDDIWNNPYSNQNDNWNQNIDDVYYGNVLRPSEYNALVTSLKENTSFDKDKSAIILSVARNSNFSSEQIYGLLMTFSFENAKLQMAKDLYLKCVDRQNYFMVNKAFDFDKSKRELAEFISKI